jgi:hypothetical protein
MISTASVLLLSLLHHFHALLLYFTTGVVSILNNFNNVGLNSEYCFTKVSIGFHELFHSHSSHFFILPFDASSSEQMKNREKWRLLIQEAKAHPEL